MRCESSEWDVRAVYLDRKTFGARRCGGGEIYSARYRRGIERGRVSIARVQCFNFEHAVGRSNRKH